MSEATDSYFWLITSILVIPLICLSIYFSIKKKRLHQGLENQLLNARIDNLEWYMSLNIGALVLTPIWALANGFVISAIAYVVFAVLWPPLTALIALFFFVCGNQLSWSGGNRWDHDFETFLEDQSFWAALGLLTLLVVMMAYI